MKSPLEDKPEILEAIGKFTVLHNGIDESLNTQFYFIVDQQDGKKRPVLDYLCSRDFAVKVDLLKNILGEKLVKELYKINDFRVVLSHGIYGMSSDGSITTSKRQKSGTFTNTDLNLDQINKFIERQRAIIQELHGLVLARMNLKK